MENGTTPYTTVQQLCSDVEKMTTPYSVRSTYINQSKEALIINQ